MTATSTTATAGPGGPAPAGIAADPMQRRTLVVLVVAQILGTIGLGVAPSIGILLAGEVTDSEAWAGLARTSSTLGAAVLGVPLGSLAARRGRRIALTTGWWMAAAGAGLLVAAAQWQLVGPLFLGLLMTGAGTAAALQARFTATDLATPGTRARSLSLVVWMGAIGNVLGPNLGVPGEALGAVTGLSTYAAAFLIAAVGSAFAGTVILVLLRPDPLHVLARRQADVLPSEDSAPADGPALASAVGAALPATPRPGTVVRLRRVAGALQGNRRARTALIALLTSQVVMVSLMTMTPVHLEHQGDSLTIIGLTISLHVAGMYGLSPVVGYLVDRLGPRAVVGLGIVLFAMSLGLAIGASGSTVGIVASLILLGLGWSFMNVAGAAMFSTVVEDRSRASAQGGADALSNLFGASAAFVAGPLMAVTSFAALGVAAAVVMIPVVLLVLRPGACPSARPRARRCPGGRRTLVTAHGPRCSRDRRCPAQSRQNSLPSGSVITMNPPLIGGSGSWRRTRAAPRATRRSHSASSAAIRASPSRPGAARTSRWTRFLAVLSSGTRWKNSRGPSPSGSSSAETPLRSEAGTPIRSRKPSQASWGSAPVAWSNPGGPGCT